MEAELILSNYRGFADDQPAKLKIRPGMTSLIGANNSGKSTLLRFFFEFRSLLSSLSNQDFVQQILTQDSVSFALANTVRDASEVFHNGNSEALIIRLDFAEPNSPDQLSLILKIPRDQATVSGQLKRCGSLLNTRLTGMVINDFKVHTDGPHSSIIADLNGLVELANSLKRCMYIPAFRSAISVTPERDYFDMQIGKAFIHAWSQNKTGFDIRMAERISSLEEDIKRIFGYGSLEIIASADETTLHLMIDKKRRRLDEVGSGIAQFILVLMNCVIKNPTFLLIDEPESNLHPTLQLDFLTTIGSYASQGVIFATHSLGLARSASEWVYSVSKDDRGRCTLYPYEAEPNLAELLGALNYSGYAQLGHKKVLLVEGPSDVLTIQQMLRLYNKEHQFAIMPLFGNSLINSDSARHLEQIQSICPNIYAVIDSERSNKDDEISRQRQGFVKVCKSLKIECLVMDWRAIENYLSEPAIQRFKGADYHSLKEYELLKTMSPNWSKSENWRIAREMKKEELDDTDLGKFLSDL